MVVGLGARGSLADRYDRRTVLIWAQVVMMAVAVALWALWATGRRDHRPVLGCVVIGGLGAGLTTSTWVSFVPQLALHRATQRSAG